MGIPHSIYAARMSEWFKELVLRSNVVKRVGSNPTSCNKFILTNIKN